MAWSLTHWASGFVWAGSSEAGWGKSGNWPWGPVALWVGRGRGRGRVCPRRREARSSLPGLPLLCAGSTPCPGRSRAPPGVTRCFSWRPPDFLFKRPPTPPKVRPLPGTQPCRPPRGDASAGGGPAVGWFWLSAGPGSEARSWASQSPGGAYAGPGRPPPAFSVRRLFLTTRSNVRLGVMFVVKTSLVLNSRRKGAL